MIDRIENDNERVYIEQLYDYYSLRLPGYILKRFGLSTTDMEDAMEMIFERIIRHRVLLMTLNKDEELQYVLAICRSVSMDIIRKNTREQKYLYDTTHNIEIIDASFENELIQNEEDRHHIQKILEVIHREGYPIYDIFMLKYVKKMKNKDIGAYLNINPSTVGTLIHRTIGKIKQEIWGTNE